MCIYENFSFILNNNGLLLGYIFGGTLYIRHEVGEILFDIACKSLNPNGFEGYASG